MLVNRVIPPYGIVSAKLSTLAYSLTEGRD
jgi:hypothetical protein